MWKLKLTLKTITPSLHPLRHLFSDFWPWLRLSRLMWRLRLWLVGRTCDFLSFSHSMVFLSLFLLDGVLLFCFLILLFRDWILLDSFVFCFQFLHSCWLVSIEPRRHLSTEFATSGKEWIKCPFKAGQLLKVTCHRKSLTKKSLHAWVPGFAGFFEIEYSSPKWVWATREATPFSALSSTFLPSFRALAWLGERFQGVGPVGLLFIVFWSSWFVLILSFLLCLVGGRNGVWREVSWNWFRETPEIQTWLNSSVTIKLCKLAQLHGQTWPWYLTIRANHLKTT